jgi:hypothetical protein
MTGVTISQGALGSNDMVFMFVWIISKIYVNICLSLI